MSFFYRRHAQEAHRYPKPDLTLWVRRTIVAAILEAWAEMLRNALPLNDEDEVTAVLTAILNGIRADTSRIPAFNSLFAMVVRDARQVTFDGRHLHERPDLVFRLADELDEYVGWFVECKIVDAKHRQGLYWSNGITRFIDGDYAWAMSTALMIAYAGEGYTLPDRLSSIAGSAPTSCQEYPDVAMWQTRHDRTWCYPGTMRTAGPITLHHLWLHGAGCRRDHGA